MSAVSAFPAGDAAAAGASAAAAVFGAAVSPSVNAAAAAASALQLDEEEEEECAAEKGESTAEEKAARRDAAILKQVEFYFSDANLPTDEFLLGRIRANKHGWGACAASWLAARRCLPPFLSQFPCTPSCASTR